MIIIVPSGVKMMKVEYREGKVEIKSVKEKKNGDIIKVITVHICFPYNK